MNKYCLPHYPATLLCLLLLLSLAACKNFITPELGAIARKEARFSMDDGTISKGLLKTKQLQLGYDLTSSDGGFTITGTMTLDPRVYSSFPIIRRFFLKMNFLDGEGRVLGTSDITPVFNTSSYISDTMEVRRSGPRPPGSTAVAFNYFGNFSSESQGVKGDDWEIFYFPFD